MPATLAPVPAAPGSVLAVDGYPIVLSHLDKVLYPACGLTKAEVLGYYAGIATVMLEHLRGRPVTTRRFPEGVGGQGFYQKNIPPAAPSWVPRREVELAHPSGPRQVTTHVLVQDRATLLWLVNLAAIELHVPMWRFDARGEASGADLVVFDLDPGPGTDIRSCCRLARLVRDALAADGLASFPKTSGSKGLQLYAPLEEPHPEDWTVAYARELAERLAARMPGEVTANMRKDLRGGRVLVDWSQNRAAKTTVAPYSLRARPQPTVSTPVSWEEVERCGDGDAGTTLVFGTADVLRRVEELGDLFSGVQGGAGSV